MEKKPLWYRLYGKVVKLFLTKKTKLVNLGAPIEGPSIIISNHEGAAGPLTWEFYLKQPKRFWSTHEMTEGVKPVFRYLAYYYFPEKKHFPKLLSRFIGFIGSPFVSLTFKGMTPIPTHDSAMKLVSTLRMSEAELKDGKAIIIFPEDSSKGYFEKPVFFYSGFAVLCERMLAKGIDLPVYVAYFSREKRVITIDAPVMFSKLKESIGARDEIAEALRLRMNELADL